MESAVQVLTADYHNPDHARAIEALLGAYAEDPQGGGEALDAAVLASVVSMPTLQCT